MNSSFIQRDVVIVGGAFSGASVALLIRRKRPDTRITVIERSTEFDRKVGESTSEVAGCFLTRVLGLNSYLSREHIAKHGLRMWFSDDQTKSLDDCTEIGGRFQSRLAAFQIDREKLDTHLLDLAEREGCEVLRPATVKSLELSEDGDSDSVITVSTTDGMVEYRAAWIVDASGKASMIPRQLGLLEKPEDHPTNAMWARFKGVRDLDSDEVTRDNPGMASSACQTPRGNATNHLMGYGWWCWLIPLINGDLSAGLVYDTRLFSPEKKENIAATLQHHLKKHPVGKAMFAGAEPVEKDSRVYSNLPYYSRQVCGSGWVVVGDAAGFMDPLYSQGLDYCAHTVSLARNIVCEALDGGDTAESASDFNRDFVESYHRWHNALYRNKYEYLGDAEIMWAAFLMDVGLYYLGPVRLVYDHPETEFPAMPYRGIAGRRVSKWMGFYNRRLTAIARKRLAKGIYGCANHRRRFLVGGFRPDWRVGSTILRGVRQWLWLEIKSL